MELKDYAHFYLGAELFTGTGTVLLSAIRKEIIPCTEFKILVLNGNVEHEASKPYEKLKLVLRPFSSITDEEKKIAGIASEGHTFTTPFEAMRYLCEQRVDIFGLIDKGLAVNKNDKSTWNYD